MLKKISTVKIEHNLTVCQPDIALLDQNEKVFAAIEIVVTHKPEPKVVQFYKENGIILIQIKLTSDKDIDDLDNKIAVPDVVEFCFSPKCTTCHNFQQKTLMTIIDGSCWNCDSTMKVAAISSSSCGMMRGGSNNIKPSDFKEEEIAFANAHGAFIKMVYSKTTKRRYNANCCGQCGSFTGDHFLFREFISPAGFGELPSQTIEFGFHCSHCEELEFEGRE